MLLHSYIVVNIDTSPIGEDVWKGAKNHPNNSLACSKHFFKRQAMRGWKAIEKEQGWSNKSQELEVSDFWKNVCVVCMPLIFWNF